MILKKWIEIAYAIPQTVYCPKTSGLTLHNPVKIYYPSSGSDYPLIIFSHGKVVGHLVHEELLEDISKAGYIVAAISHRDLKLKKDYGVNLVTAAKPQENELLCVRIYSITPAIDAVLSHPRIQPIVNPDRIGGVCVSLGNAILLGVSGAKIVRPKVAAKVSAIATDNRLRVIVGLSPFFFNSHPKGKKLLNCSRKRIRTNEGNSKVTFFGKFDLGLPGLQTVDTKTKAYTGTCDGTAPLDDTTNALDVIGQQGYSLGVVEVKNASHKEPPFIVPSSDVIADLNANV